MDTTFNESQVAGWQDGGSLFRLQYDAGLLPTIPARVTEGTIPNIGSRIVETIHSDTHGVITVASRNGFAAWHREQTDPRYAWMTGRYRTGDRE